MQLAGLELMSGSLRMCTQKRAVKQRAFTVVLAILTGTMVCVMPANAQSSSTNPEILKKIQAIKKKADEEWARRKGGRALRYAPKQSQDARDALKSNDGADAREAAEKARIEAEAIAAREQEAARAKAAKIEAEKIEAARIESERKAAALKAERQREELRAAEELKAERVRLAKEAAAKRAEKERVREEKQLADANRIAEERRREEQRRREEAQRERLEAERQRANEQRARSERESDARRKSDQERREKLRRELERERAKAAEAKEASARAERSVTERMMEAERRRQLEESRRHDWQRAAQVSQGRYTEGTNSSGTISSRDRQAKADELSRRIENARGGRSALGGRDIDAPGSSIVQNDRSVTILLIMNVGKKGVRLWSKTADPMLCIKDKCYLSQGADKPAQELLRSKAFGPTVALGERGLACRSSPKCVFRDVDLHGRSASLQPVDLRFVRHDRRPRRRIAADETCTVVGDRLLCDKLYGAGDWRAWVVPESIADWAGPKLLKLALERGLK